jgi:hypothetical protein
MTVHELAVLVTVQVELRCRGELLQKDITLAEVQQLLWRPHTISGQLLQLSLSWHAAKDAPG